MNEISSCDENRLRRVQQIEASFALARKLAAEGKYEKALDQYLFAFDNGRYVDGWGGVRLSYIPSEIAKLGTKYPPALDALRDRRNARENLIRKGNVDKDILNEWLSINRYLRDTSRMLAMLDEVGHELRTRIIDECFEQLLADKQYKLASQVLEDRGRSFFHWECHYESEKYFPRRVKNQNWDHEKMVEYDRQVMRKNGLKVFELALAVKRRAAAQEVARRILLHCGDGDTYIAILQIAKRVGSKSILKQLLKDAKSQLTPEDFAQVRNTVQL